MRILVISDTHGNSNRAFLAHTTSEPIDAIIHLGDGSSDADLLREILGITVINVAGNCDSDSNTPRELLWECEGKKILLTHGNMYHVKSGYTRLLQRALELKVDAALFGHTHQAFHEIKSSVLLLNPGALANHAHHRSYAVLEINPNAISFRHFDID